MGGTKNRSNPRVGGSDELVFVVDDDDSVRKALVRMLFAAGHRVESFASPTKFASRRPHEGPACLVLDLKMPEMTGLELQARLREAGHLVPIIFVSGHGDIPASVEAMRQGAIDFLSKPFETDDLLRAVRRALIRDRAALAGRMALQQIFQRWRTLTPRERQVFDCVVRGSLNKQIAGKLRLSEKTIKVYRAKVMVKMDADSVAELVRMSDALAGSLNPDALVAPAT